MVPQAKATRFYSLLGQPKPKSKQPIKPEPSKKTYWDKYPELKRLRGIGKRKLITLLFFVYLFMFSTAEHIQVMRLGYRIFIAQALVTVLSVTSVYSLEYSLKTLKVFYMIPFMSVVMGGLSCYVCLFALVMFTFANLPPFEYIFLAFHVFLLAVTSLVTFSLARSTDFLWQAFFCIVDLSLNEGMMEKLRKSSPIEEPRNGKKKRHS